MDDHSREGHSHKSKHHQHQHGRHSRRHHHHHRKSSSDGNQTEFESAPAPQLPPPPIPPVQPANPVKDKNYKLLVDPCLVKGAKKVYRYEGVVPGEPSLNVNTLKDPRPSIPRRWNLPDVIDLPVPKLKIDSNYVGDPPEVEIAITNLNDNIDKNFLTELVVKHGELEEVSIYYHPITRRHAGFARVVFSEVAAASSCVAALHSRSVMGKQLVVFFDPFGREWSRMIDNIVAPKREILPPVDSDDEGPVASHEKGKEKPPITKMDNSREEISRTIPTSSATLPLEDDGGTSPFSHKTPACNPSPIAMNLPAFPPPSMQSNLPLPNFHQPPPPLSARHPWPPVHADWQNQNMQWRHPMPSWPPRFLSPPPSIPPAPAPLPPEKENPLDLDTRIELLLKGGINGMAPPFLAMDINEESAAAAPAEEETKAQRSRASSVSSEDEPYSPPPLPPGVDLSPTYSPKVPLPTIAEYSSDKYLPLSTPPSPFISEEEYLECLLNWRLKHLSYVQQKEKEVSKRKGRQFESDKVSEISSEEDENDFKQTAINDDDKMSLSSLSSAVENIEEVAVPSNPYGSYTFGEPSTSTTQPPYEQMMIPKMPAHMHGGWPDYQGQMYPGFQPGHLPYNPLHPPPMMPDHFQHYLPETVEPDIETDPINRTVDLALERVCELLTATLEKDLMKRMTEVLAFNEFEKWWDDEEKKYNEGKKEPEKEKDLLKDTDAEEKKTADVFLSSLLDSNYDGTIGLGFRAALPKMPSFKRKQRLPSPGRGERSANFEKDRRNESDEEEMVQLSDSDSRGNEPESMMRKKSDFSDDSSDSSVVESSDSSSDESERESSESDIEKELKNFKEDFLSLIDMEKLENLRIKTPEERLTPIPSEDFIDFEDTKSQEDSDSPASSPNRSRDLSNYAMEAFKALGLDEFVRDVKIRNDGQTKIIKPKPKLISQEMPSTSTQIVKTRKVQVVKPKVEVSEVERESEIKVAVKDPSVEKEVPAVPAQPLVDDHDSEATLSPPEDIITVEHSYSRPKTAEVAEVPKKEPKIESWVLDHDYSGPIEKMKVKEAVKVKEKEAVKPKEKVKDAVKSTTKERKKKSEKLVSHLLDSYLKAPPPRSTRRYAPRESLKEMMTCYEFLTKGVDEEDMRYLKKAFESLLADEKQSYWLNDMHWANHPVTDLQTLTVKNKGHRSGCARTQGFYKLDPKEKQKLKHHYGKNKIPSESMQSTAEAKVWTAASREARSNQRRLLTAFGADTDSDLLKFNQLKFRKKLLKFGKSEIHDWGLFAKEPIAADEMVVEYVGQKVRPVLADYREQKYMKRGIGSSYLFRIDLENIIDATTRGNLARFINHSCNPNCYAKIITIEGSKKIVIYSKRDIKMDEEITYDYKFPLEEEKITCLCGDALCKGFLN